MVNMDGKDTSVPKKRGPAPTGQGTQVQVRLQPDQLAALDAWIGAHARHTEKPAVSRPEAVRLILKEMLDV